MSIIYEQKNMRQNASFRIFPFFPQNSNNSWRILVTIWKLHFT
ncbi:hypothetical protein HMPREF0294_1082 [Corynebacterium glucuronolyticum ATCC 51867]|uniref:Uncharacterized protein n=1 Tax=Corynebacterium glucuronolyticum ATCC 51866 TaxID=548478 RepID=A0ABM9XNM4_9CORY|nr:hypothetical protein HMPREF0294_1082 [Corynebacterium glucuronolyticum ATCC 51867]EEI62743.1 hypothetical protein HMPREF0293_1892 [Corynebacterium glucuronolyticum ATCC 51866]